MVVKHENINVYNEIKKKGKMGFEPTVFLHTLAFKTNTFNHSVT